VKEQAARAKTHTKPKRSEPKISVNDPAARLMRLADSALAPAWEWAQPAGFRRATSRQP
jgi:hypothetical protein